MPTLTRSALLAAATLLAAGCTGYQLGGTHPAHLAAVKSVSVPMVVNKTQTPRAAAHATNALVDAFTRDGTYRVESSARADARLEVTLHTIDYRQTRSTRTDTLRSEELQMEISLHWTLIDGDNPTKILEEGNVLGRTRFFADPNLQTARQTALTEALKRASESLVARLADGF